MDDKYRAKTQFSFVYAIVALLALLFVQEYLVGGLGAKEQEVPYSRFRQDLAEGRIEEVTVEPERIVYTVTGPQDAAEDAEARREEDTEEAGERRKAVRIEDRLRAGALWPHAHAGRRYSVAFGHRCSVTALLEDAARVGGSLTDSAQLSELRRITC